MNPGINTGIFGGGGGGGGGGIPVRPPPPPPGINPSNLGIMTRLAALIKIHNLRYHKKIATSQPFTCVAVVKSM